MWGIVLINAAGEPVDQIMIDAPFETLRDCCRQLVEGRADTQQARLSSPDGLFDFVYPGRLVLENGASAAMSGLSASSPMSRRRSLSAE